MDSTKETNEEKIKSIKNAVDNLKEPYLLEKVNRFISAVEGSNVDLSNVKLDEKRICYAIRSSIAAGMPDLAIRLKEALGVKPLSRREEAYTDAAKQGIADLLRKEGYQSVLKAMEYFEIPINSLDPESKTLLEDYRVHSMIR